MNEEELYLDPVAMFQLQCERLGRDPAKKKLQWRFTLEAQGMLDESSVMSKLEQILPRLHEALGTRQPPACEVHFDEGEDGNANTTILVVHQGKLTAENLQACHRQATHLAPLLQLNFRGSNAFAGNPRLDADEQFLQLVHILHVDPTRDPLQWKFTFGASQQTDESDAQLLLTAVSDAVGKSEDSLDASMSFTEDGSTIVEVRYQGVMKESQLAAAHKQLGKAACKLRMEYAGVETDVPPREMDIPESIQWTNGILAKTSQWNIGQMAQVSESMRDRHLRALAKVDLRAADWLPLADARWAEPKLRSKEEIVRRMMAAYITTAWVCAPEEIVPKQEVKSYLAKNKLSAGCFSRQEAEWIQAPREHAREHAPQAGWIMENIWSLAWLVGYQPTPNPSAEQVSDVVFDPIRRKLMNGTQCSFQELLAKAKLRRIESIIALEDFLYCAHNACRNKQQTMKVGVVQERRMPLTWALSPNVSWDDTDAST